MIRRRAMAFLAFVVVLGLAGCTVGYQPAAEASGPSTQIEETNLGYYDGYWYNETLHIDAEDGLSAGERDAVFSRAMARIQLLRGLRFEEDVDIEIVTRQTFRAEYDDVWSEPSENQRHLANTQYEALFLVGPDEDVVDVRRRNRGGVVLGFYQPSETRIVLVSNSKPATIADEMTLAHELLHALQDQHFRLSSFEGSTLDSHNARNGLVEGDATVVERAYERNCETGEWECVNVETGSSSRLPEGFHWGVYFVDFFPYAEGPSFVEYHRERGGWSAINSIYEDLPTASAELIHPETYQREAYGEAVVVDRNAPSWKRIEIENGSDAATVGQAGLVTMFVYTSYAGDSPGVVDREKFRGNRSKEYEAYRPYTYDIEYAAGWYADRLHAYERRGQTAYVWNVTFVDKANATEFSNGYERVVRHWGGEYRRVQEGTLWTFEGAEGPFRGAVWIERDENAVTIVKAPTESALGEVYEPAGTG